MRQFVVLAHDVPLDTEISLDDLAGGGGRFDVLSKAVISALLCSHGIRSEVRIHLVIRGAWTITLDGESLRGLHPDERSTAALLKKALEQRESAIGHQPATPSPGISMYRKDARTTLSECAERGPIVLLHEGGSPITGLDDHEDLTFVMSDHREFTDEDFETIRSFDPDEIRVGPKALFTNQTITVVHHYLDTAGYERF